MGKNTIQKITDIMDMVRKFVIGVLAVGLSLILIILYFRTTGKNRVIIQPFQLSGKLTADGYTGQLVTAMFVQRIREMQDTGRSFYLKNKTVTPSWDDKASEFSAALSESSFGEIKSLLEYFAGVNTTRATGQMALLDNNLKLIFTLDGESMSFSGGKNVDSIIGCAAEETLHRIDPFILAGYYYKKGDDVRCLQIAQEILNSPDTSHRGLANHMRGLAYLLRKDTPQAKEAFLTALRSIKSPWMTKNNLGVVYDHYNELDTASRMYREAIALKPDAFPAYLNFATELYIIRYPREKSIRVLDSSILLYRKAIDDDPREPMLYIALLPALYDKGDTVQAAYYKRKIIEMAPDNYVGYFQIAAILKKQHRNDEANLYFTLAKQHCNGDSIIVKQIESFSRRP